MQTTTATNVAPQSTKGHFIREVPVVVIDQVGENFFVPETAELVSENHQTLTVFGGCEVFPQQVYNPTEGFVRAKD
jgi:hypothetical protein